MTYVQDYQRVCMYLVHFAILQKKKLILKHVLVHSATCFSEAISQPKHYFSKVYILATSQHTVLHTGSFIYGTKEFLDFIQILMIFCNQNQQFCEFF